MMMVFANKSYLQNRAKNDCAPPRWYANIVQCVYHMILAHYEASICDMKICKSDESSSHDLGHQLQSFTDQKLVYKNDKFPNITPCDLFRMKFCKPEANQSDGQSAKLFSDHLDHGPLALGKI